MKLSERVLVVAGGAGLLGQAFVRAIALEGGVAIMADRDFAKARDAAAAIDGAPGRVVAMRLDITDEESVESLMSTLYAEHGRIDGVVNSAYPRNAGYGRLVTEVTYSDFCDNLSSHLGGYFLVMQRFAARFAMAGAGSIVNLSSVYGTIAPRFDVYAGTEMTMPVEYAAIKAGILQLTRYFAQFYKQRGVRVNSLSPGGVLDGQSPTFVEAYRAYAGSKGMLAPSDVTGALLFLLSDDSRHVTGCNLVVDDGFSL